MTASSELVAIHGGDPVHRDEQASPHQRSKARLSFDGRRPDEDRLEDCPVESHCHLGGVESSAHIARGLPGADQGDHCLPLSATFSVGVLGANSCEGLGRGPVHEGLWQAFRVGGDAVAEGKDCFDELCAGGEELFRVGRYVRPAPVERSDEQILFRGEVEVEGSLRDAGSRADLVNGHLVEAEGRELFESDRDETVTGSA